MGSCARCTWAAPTTTRRTLELHRFCLGGAADPGAQGRRSHAGLRARPEPRASHRGGAHQLRRSLQRAEARPRAWWARRPRHLFETSAKWSTTQAPSPFPAAAPAAALASPAAAPDPTADLAAASTPAAPAFTAPEIKSDAAEPDDDAEIASATANLDFQIHPPFNL